MTPGTTLRRLADGHVAEAARDAGDSAAQRCDACGAPIEGEPAGRGLYVWTRGDEVRREEPPLCEDCARAIGAALRDDEEDEEDDG